MRMHADEVEVDAALVAQLVADQFPHLRHLPLREVSSTGTVNGIYRIGSELDARMSRVPAWSDGLDRECRWLPTLAPRLPLDIPQPVAVGRPSTGYPLPWAIFRWIEGQPYADERVEDERRAARDLAHFVLRLRAVELFDGAPPAGRRPLRDLDADTRSAIAGSSDEIDSRAALAAWDVALEAPPWEGAPVWIHADLLRPNILVRDGRVRAVIDFGAVGVGDPAADVIAAWAVFRPVGRAAYRAALDVDDDTWSRARGVALHQAAAIIPYYAQTNPGLVALARRTVEQVLEDLNG